MAIDSKTEQPNLPIDKKFVLLKNNSFAIILFLSTDKTGKELEKENTAHYKVPHFTITGFRLELFTNY